MSEDGQVRVSRYMQPTYMGVINSILYRASVELQKTFTNLWNYPNLRGALVNLWTFMPRDALDTVIAQIGVDSVDEYIKKYVDERMDDIKREYEKEVKACAERYARRSGILGYNIGYDERTCPKEERDLIWQRVYATAQVWAMQDLLRKIVDALLMHGWLVAEETILHGREKGR